MKQNFTPRTESDRIQVAILDCLEGILAEIKKTKTTYNDEQVVSDKIVEQIKAEVEPKKTTPRKKKGE